jgi:predicted RNase H-like HicB family nuclease
MKKPAYPVVIEYSAEDKGYVARVPALKYCTAFGDTYEEAAREIETAIRLHLDAAKANGIPVPPPGPDIIELKGAADVLNLKELARRIGISEQTLYAKIRRGSELKERESVAIGRELNAVGLHLERAAG